MRDEAALARWRNLEEHRLIMAKGRGGVLRDYRIRATSVLWDYSMENRTEAPGTPASRRLNKETAWTASAKGN